MLMILSPAKSLDMTPMPQAKMVAGTTPEFMAEATRIARDLATYSKGELKQLFGVSEAIAALNHARYQAFTAEPAKPCALAFQGDVYQGLEAHTFNAKHWAFADAHMRILSGLYGALRPRDAMYAYRLEMGTRLDINGVRLADYWRARMAASLEHAVQNAYIDGGDAVLLNLASNEYFAAVDAKGLTEAGVRIVQPVFQDYKNGAYKMISFFAKRARGAMARYIIDEGITDIEAIKHFPEYAFCAQASTPNRWVFQRKAA